MYATLLQFQIQGFYQLCARLSQPGDKVVTTIWYNLASRLPQPSHNLVTTLLFLFLYGLALGSTGHLDYTHTMIYMLLHGAMFYMCTFFNICDRLSINQPSTSKCKFWLSEQIITVGQRTNVRLHTRIVRSRLLLSG